MNVIISNVNKDVLSLLEVDVLKSISGEFTADEIIQSFSNFFYNRMFLDITAIKDYKNIKNIQKLSMSLDVSKLIILLSSDVNNDFYKTKLVSMGIYNFTDDIVGLKYLYDNPNSYKDVAQFHDVDEDMPSVDNISLSSSSNIGEARVRVFGFKNATIHAGATSLVYILKNELSLRYNVVAIEVDKKDFLYFKDKSMISVKASDLGNTVFKYKDADIVLVDMNDMDDSVFDGDVYYLVEPSTIKINKMMINNKDVLSKLVDKKVILNQSLLNNSDVRAFEHEAGFKVFYNLPPMSDKTSNSNVLLPFLEKLGLVKRVDDTQSKKSNGLFGLFRK